MQNTDATGIFPELDEREAFSSDFDAIKISIASPEKIRAWSHGEVTKAETINYRTLKPERGGLFCAQIFGPVNDWECLCGKYKRMKHRGVVCDKCGVEVTQASVRRSRLGHIELACPVSHVWFFKVPPSRIGQVLDLTPRELERVLYYESYVVLDPGDVDLTLLRDRNILFTGEEVQSLQQLFAFSFDEIERRFCLTAVKTGTLKKGQQVTETQRQLLDRTFGTNEEEFREKTGRSGRPAATTLVSQFVDDPGAVDLAMLRDRVSESGRKETGGSPKTGGRRAGRAVGIELNRKDLASLRELFDFVPEPAAKHHPIGEIARGTLRRGQEITGGQADLLARLFGADDEEFREKTGESGRACRTRSVSRTVVTPGQVQVELLRAQKVELTEADAAGLRELFEFSTEPSGDGVVVSAVETGALRVGQVVSDDQQDLLTRLFGATDSEFRGRMKLRGKKSLHRTESVHEVVDPGEVDLALLKQAKTPLSAADLSALHGIFDFEETYRIGAIENGALRKQQVVSREQDRLLRRLFGATDTEFRERMKIRGTKRGLYTLDSLHEVADPGEVDLNLVLEQQKAFTEAEMHSFQQLFRCTSGEIPRRYSIANVRLGTLRQGQVVTEEQDRLLKRLFGRTDNEFRERMKMRGRTFMADMGAGAAKQLLRGADLDHLADELRDAMRNERSIQKKAKAAKRLKVVDAFRKSGNLPEWMIMESIPVLPPDLRPLVPLDGGRFATSDLNELYRKVINRNNRLRRLLELRAPDVIVRNEQRMLQEAVDALFDNGRRGRVLKGTNNRPLKSLSDTLKGKQGRFRQNLLGKRVDYSGRSVIVVGPELKLHQCGLPKKMALELFKPFLFNRLEAEGLADTIKQARELVEQQRPEVWDFLEEVISGHSVLLNRAPTLHRLGIQAFEPVMVEGKAIRIHPLVCSAFNADFDGDQMAVHVPLSPESQVEASLLMRSSKNILSPAHGGPLAVPTQDMVLGIYYLTKPQVLPPEKTKIFADTDEVLLALDSGEVSTLTPIELRYTGEVMDTHDSQNLLRIDTTRVERRRIATTVGRVIFNDHLPPEAPFVNGVLKKRGIQNLIRLIYLRFGLEATAGVLDSLKDLGFHYATLSGTSIGLGDLVVPPNKANLVEEAKSEVGRVEEEYQGGAITEGERYNKVIDVWSNATNRVAEDMLATMQARERETGRFNPVFMMVDSGARGSEKQIRQLAGMRGLMAKTTGAIIETPITSNFREGLSVIQYFISTNGARKGLADTALRTADAGYLTRRLADVAQDVIVTDMDCGTLRGIYAEPIIEAGEVIEPLRERIVGRVSLDAVKDFRGERIVDAGEEISERIAGEIENSGVQRVKIRSVLTCDARRGVCAMCYGRNLATGKLVDLGEAVGIIAAQSIGEPGTQLTMRTFHIGGTASVFENSALEARNEGTIRFSENLRLPQELPGAPAAVESPETGKTDAGTTDAAPADAAPTDAAPTDAAPTDAATVAAGRSGLVRDRHGNLVVISRSGSVEVVDEAGRSLESHPVVYGARIMAAAGERVEPGKVIVEWDPYSFSILSEERGTVRFRDIISDITMIQEVDDVTFRSQAVIIESTNDLLEPRIEIADEEGNTLRTYLMPSRAHLEVAENDVVRPGDVLAKIPRETTKNKDITGGLPRVVELFEARPPKEPALISEIDGRLEYGEVRKAKRVVRVVPQGDGDPREYEVPRGKHISVPEHEEIRAGDPLMDGARNPHDILRVLGEGELQRYLVNEVQEVYRLQGVVIDDKHIEVIISRMMRWVRVTDVGDTDLIVDSILDRHEFVRANRKAEQEGGQSARGEPMLLGLTKASLATDSFISAASFQETTKVLTEASLNGKVDYLRGLKENVIMGRLIPAGTGLRAHQAFFLPEDVDAHRDAILARQSEEADLSYLEPTS